MDILSIRQKVQDKIGTDGDMVWVVLHNARFVVMVMEMSGVEAFGYVHDRLYPESAELGYLDMREYAKDMEVMTDFVPCKLDVAKRLFSL